jgi:hypothetical protein
MIVITPSLIILFLFSTCFKLVSLDNIQIYMNELSEGKKNAHDFLKQNADLKVLKDFLSNIEIQFQEIENKYKSAKIEFHACIAYFGEISNSTNSFFLVFVRFIKAFKVCQYQYNRLIFRRKQISFYSFLLIIE